MSFRAWPLDGRMRQTCRSVGNNYSRGKILNNPKQNCYLCGVPVREYDLKPGEKHPSDELTLDHIPPMGLFPKPRPDDLIKVPCCFECNNKHSGFDERLRIVASMPFDRNEVGQRILDEKVIGSTFARERQMQFVEKLAVTMQAVSERPELIRAGIDDQEFKDGMIRITKGLLFTLHPDFDFYNQLLKPFTFGSSLLLSH